MFEVDCEQLNHRKRLSIVDADGDVDMNENSMHLFVEKNFDNLNEFDLEYRSMITTNSIVKHDR